MEHPEIEPCPFCDYPDNGAPIPTRILAGIEILAVLCNGCGTSGPEGETPERAIAAWNGAGGWISVEDDLPEDSERVLAYGQRRIYTNNLLPHEMRDCDYISDEGWMLPGNTYFENVTHWQPLPPPPE